MDKMFSILALIFAFHSFLALKAKAHRSAPADGEPIHHRSTISLATE
jgi:hypothetical protein